MKGRLGLILFGLVALSAQLALAAPRLEISSTELDLGQARQGQVLKGVFELNNQGDSPLVIERVSPG